MAHLGGYAYISIRIVEFDMGTRESVVTRT